MSQYIYLILTHTSCYVTMYITVKAGREKLLGRIHNCCKSFTTVAIKKLKSRTLTTLYQNRVQNT